MSGYDSNASEEELEIQSRCMQPGVFCVDYQRVSDEPAAGLFALGDEARWLQPQSRVRSILSSKIDHVVKGERNVIVVDISHANVTEREVADAVYWFCWNQSWPGCCDWESGDVGSNTER